MIEPAVAFWRRLDRPGHDAATIEKVDSGWVLTGFAVFSENGATGLRYQLDLEADFSTRGARIEGLRDGRRFNHSFCREGGWSLDGKPVEGLDDLVHLDFGFTPATNLAQLRRLSLTLGQTAELTVAWLDVFAGTLAPLGQQYQRLSDKIYAYEAPAFGYADELEVDPVGFVVRYPRLWEVE